MVGSPQVSPCSVLGFGSLQTAGRGFEPFCPCQFRKQMMAKTNPFEFIQEVRQEARKITWPTRKETMITTVMVLIMVALASVFFLLVDTILQWGVDKDPVRAAEP